MPDKVDFKFAASKLHEVIERDNSITEEQREGLREVAEFYVSMFSFRTDYKAPPQMADLIGQWQSSHVRIPLFIDALQTGEVLVDVAYDPYTADDRPCSVQARYESFG